MGDGLEGEMPLLSLLLCFSLGRKTLSIEEGDLSWEALWGGGGCSLALGKEQSEGRDGEGKIDIYTCSLMGGGGGNMSSCSANTHL